MRFEKENKKKDFLGHGYKHKRSFIEEEIWKICWLSLE